MECLLFCLWYCSITQQYKLATYCEDIFEDYLLKRPLDSSPACIKPVDIFRGEAGDGYRRECETVGVGLMRGAIAPPSILESWRIASGNFLIFNVENLSMLAISLYMHSRSAVMWGIMPPGGYTKLSHRFSQQIWWVDPEISIGSKSINSFMWPHHWICISLIT